MITIHYVIQDELGIHARPAGMLVNKAKGFESDIKIGTEAKMVDAKRVMGVMTLALKQGDTLTMAFEGPDKEKAAEEMDAFLKENL